MKIRIKLINFPYSEETGKRLDYIAEQLGYKIAPLEYVNRDEDEDSFLFIYSTQKIKQEALVKALIASKEHGIDIPINNILFLVDLNLTYISSEKGSKAVLDILPKFVGAGYNVTLVSPTEEERNQYKGKNVVLIKGLPDAEKERLETLIYNHTISTNGFEIIIV